MAYENGSDPEYDYSHREEEHYEYPYQKYYGDGGGGPTRHGGGHHGWLIFLILAVLVTGGVLFLSRYSVDLRQTGKGLTLSIQDQNADTAAPPAQPDAAVSTPPATAQIQPAPTGSGTKLTLAEGMGGLHARPGELSLKEIYKKVIPSVVSITTTLQNGVATGTGIVMSRDGYIITNNHVIDGALAVEVLLSNNETYPASLVGSDETSDLAVLKIAVKNLVPAEFGDSERMEVGDAVVAIGDPLGKELRGTMTDGIISAINRDLSINGRQMTLMQTNAALNNGNSGGPLINNLGQVIGVNTMKMSALYYSAAVEGLGFAIPISTAKPIIDELIAQGYVSGRPAIGITGDALPQSAQSYYRLPEGVYVSSVDPASDAYAKGIAPGDIITAINEIPVGNMDSLNSVKNQYAAGDTVTLRVFRNNEEFQVQVVLMDRAGS